MKKHILPLAILLALLSGGNTARAEVQAVVLFINTNITNYTVPAGKVLLIEHLSGSEAGNNPATPRIIVETKILNIVNNGISTMHWGFPVRDKWESVTLARPLRIPAGGIIGILSTGDVGFDNVRMMGLLIDAADQYAANIGGSVDGVDKAGGTLMAKLTMVSPRPVRINSDISSDLASWTPNLTERKIRKANPRVWDVG
ncbi:MAG TPA: hypothetical protein VK327_06625, partial [Candidatus Paceibacterota bacterium]|nr:hypothetical protein [Candidatus Paceibacterota bacterium]